LQALYHRFQMRSFFFAAFVALPACSLCVAGCRSLPPSKPASLFTIEEASGAQVYQQNCARCHYPTTTHSLKGPGLQAITKVKAMPSGAPPTNDRLTSVILHGRNMMPPAHLTDQQLSDLLAYLHTL
jgi:mono/diheme cytochrome c family protein